MRKIHLTMVSILFITITTDAQSGKKEPPPPPPKMETAKLEPPKTIKDEKVKVPVVKGDGKFSEEFYSRNQQVAHVSRQRDLIFIKLKDGTGEKYDLTKKEEENIFTKKYGRLPIPPPPPPPPAKTNSD